MKEVKKKGLEDVVLGIKKINLAFFLARSDIRQRYRRSSLGPFWITISTGVMIATLGIIFGKIFKSPVQEFLPFLASGLILWGFISQVILDATAVFVSSEAIIKQLPIPYFVHVVRMVCRNFIIFLHNVVIIPIVFIVFRLQIQEEIFLILPGIVILVLNLLWMSLFLGILCTRYRDMTQVIASCLQIVFYVTPIIWLPSLIPAKSSAMLLDPNPFYHLIQIVRQPILGQCPTVMNWIVTICLCLFGWLFTLCFFNRYRTRIAYWL